MVNFDTVKRLWWRRQEGFVLAGLTCLLVLLLIVSLRIGRYPVSVREVVRLLFSLSPSASGPAYANAAWVAVNVIRVPRIFLVTLCGMGLALSGAAMQGVFRNPLVGPEIVGVSAGASCGGVLAIMLALPALGVVGLAFAFGLLALIAAFALTRRAGQGATLALVLSGVVVGTFFSSVVGFLQTIADPTSKLPSIVYWLLGSFVGATYQKLLIVAVVILLAGTPLLLLRWRINLLSLGEEDCAALGISVPRLRWIIIGLVTLIVAAQVSVSGGVAWVGLIIPHMARMLVGPSHSKLLPASALLGGLYLLLMDDLARSIGPQEIPIGLLTSIVGAPIFAALFWKMQGRGWGHE